MKIRLSISIICLVLLLSVPSFGATVIHETWESSDSAQWGGGSALDGTIVVNSDQAHKGAYSLNVDIDVADGHAYKTTTASAQYLSDYHVSAWVYMTSELIATIANATDYITLWNICGTSCSNETQQLLVYYTSGAVYIILTYNNGANYVLTLWDSVWEDTWIHIESHHKVDNADGDIELWVNGILKDSDIGVDTDDSGNAGSIQVGAASSSVAVGEYYIDNFIIDNEDKYIGLGYAP